MKLPWKKSADQAIDAVFTPPKKHAHRGFVYLDDDIVVNSLSVLESGKVDEIAEKINIAQESGMSIGMKMGTGTVGASADASGKGSESLQAEVIRRRTRFSIFEAWLEAICSREAIGRFTGWGPNVLRDVEAGQVIQLQGTVDPMALHAGIRMYLWFANEVRQKSPLFKTTSVKEIQEPEQIFKAILGKRPETNATFKPVGENGPTVAVSFREGWIVEPVGRWNGSFNLVAQVEEVISESESWQALRLIEDAPFTPLEETAINGAFGPILEAIKAFGIEVDESSFSIKGPALILRPIAMFR